MKLVLYLVIGIVVVIALLGGLVALIGSRLPKTHTASRSILLQRPPAEVYAVVRDFASAPSWRTDLKSVEIQNRPGERLRFREEGKNGTVNYELEEDAPPARMVTRITDTDLGYAGKWTYVFTAETGGTRLTITEDGEVSNLLFRVMSRYVFGQTGTLDAYLMSLAKKFGERAEPQ